MTTADPGIAVRVGFHYPSSRAELTARELWCIFDTRQLGPSTWVVETGRPCTRLLRHPARKRIWPILTKTRAPGARIGLLSVGGCGRIGAHSLDLLVG